jgi:hypothetical protein
MWFRSMVVACSLSAVAMSQTTEPLTVPASTQAFLQALAQAKPGEEIQTSFAATKPLAVLPLSITPASVQPQFLLSDQPEYFRNGNGIAMQETVEAGVVRLYVYHVPVLKDGKPKKIVAVIDNLGAEPLKLTTHARALAPIGGDYHKMAKGVMRTIVSDATTQPSEPRVIEKRANLDEAMSKPVSKEEMLVHGYYELHLSQPARISVAQLDADDSIDVIDRLERLPRVLPGWHNSGAGRGLFRESVFEVTTKEGASYDARTGVAVMTVADGKSDRWMAGTDGIDPSTPIVNKGNYGAVYRFDIAIAPSDKPIAVLMVNPYGASQWCKVAAAAVRTSEGVLDVPSGKVRFNALPDAVLLQTIAPSTSPRRWTMTYTPPGASCLPTPILLVPME